MKSTVKSKRLHQFVATAAAAFSAITITYRTSGPKTGCNGTSDLSVQSSLASANSPTLTFVPNASGSSGLPSDVNLGDLTLACSGSTPVSGSTFSAFTFNWQITGYDEGRER